MAAANPVVSGKLVTLPSPVQAEVLSPSQVNCFLHCPASWYYRYVARLPFVRSASLAMGDAVHAALATNFSQKLESGQDLPVDDVAAAFRAEWEEAIRDVSWQEGEDAADLAAAGEQLVRLYMEQVAPLVRPRRVESEVTAEFGGARIRARVDLIDQAGTVIELKTAGSDPGRLKQEYVLQLGTYVFAEGVAAGKIRVDTLVRLKTKVKLVQYERQLGEADLRYLEAVYGMVRTAIQDGVYYPRRSSNLCSRRYCSYWQACEEEFGGEVPA